MYYKFTSDISRLGPILTPYVLEIEDDFITYSKRNKNLFNKDTITIDIVNISLTKVNSSLLGTTLTIVSLSGEEIIVKNMNIKDAKEAESIIKKLRKQKSL